MNSRDIMNMSKDKVRRNRIRAKIKNFFKKRSCNCIVRPINDEKKLANIEKQDWNDLRPEFISEVDKLVN